MKNLFLAPLKIISRIFWGLVRFITRLVLSLAMTLAILLLVFYFLNESNLADSSLAKTFNQGLANVTHYFNQAIDQSSAEDVSHLATDHVETEGQIYRWETARASIYIASTDPSLVAAYEQAIANWNATGAFTFVRVDQAEGANIIATDYSDSQTQAAGLAESEADPLTNRFLTVTVKLNSYYLLDRSYGYDQDRILHTAEHELGHAIGLDHEDHQQSVMESAGSYTGIQAYDIQEVRELYAS